LAGIAEVLAGDRDEIAGRLAGPVVEPPPAGMAGGPTRRYNSREAYEAGVRRAKDYIRAGDAFQIVLSQRAERPTSASPVAIYRALRRVNPSPYLFILELGDL